MIEHRRQQIKELDRKANPLRYRLSSGAEFVRIDVADYHHPSLHIWTRVGDALFENTKFQIDYYILNGQLTDEEFVNAVFEPFEIAIGASSCRNWRRGLIIRYVMRRKEE